MKLLKRKKGNHIRIFQRKAIEKQKRFFVLVIELVDFMWEFMNHVGSTFGMNENRPHHVREIGHVEDPNSGPNAYHDINRYLRTGMAYTKVVTRANDSFFYKELKNPAMLTKSTKARIRLWY
ncbi:unnamed protein product [Rhizophagus irregularis]|uniref:Uncharacterized protein n=1 Tax=Rhizophagus irregularis TaxID=588596 RepID=A0A2I1FZR1_9GLOM|nr:hypothetical protein RhiirA4_453135 [Rhizophagus irregularis]CAB4432547.1 unnamed protein product [Rhizophagus irregularis]